MTEPQEDRLRTWLHAVFASSRFDNVVPKAHWSVDRDLETPVKLAVNARVLRPLLQELETPEQVDSARFGLRWTR